MTQLTIEIPDVVAEYLERQVFEGKGASVNEVVSRMLSLQCERSSIEQKVLEAYYSNDATEVTPEFWDRMRERAIQLSKQAHGQ